MLVGFMVVADAFTVASLAILRPDGWFPPFLGFGIVLVGLIWLATWAIGHRHDDESDHKDRD